MLMINYSQLNLDLNSTLKDLELDDVTVDISCLGGRVYQIFEQNPILSGVILQDRQQFFGMISRQRFLEKLSRPYGLELFFNRAIANLYKVTQQDLLILSDNTSIVEAAQQAIERPSQLLYEPLVIHNEQQQYKLLDTQKLLIAQSQIHQFVANLLKQTTQKLKAANIELSQLASIDGLTQIANRRRFDEYLEIQWHKLSLQQEPLGLLLCDVDRFKAYNDYYGHQAGDDCLQKVAQVLKEVASDPDYLVARYGGEEFAVILPGVTLTQSQIIAECICDRLRALKILHGGLSCQRYVTVSIGGMSMIPNREDSPLNLVLKADRLLYQAKRHGRDRFIINSDQ